MDYLRHNMRAPANMIHCVSTAVLILSLVGACLCKSTVAPTENITWPSTHPTNTTAAIHTANSTLKPLESAEVKTTASPTTKESGRTTKANSAGRTTVVYSTTEVYVSTKSVVKSARRLKLNTSSSTAVHSLVRLQERLAAIDCDLPVLPRESRLWRGNETHELNLPVTACAGGGEECPPVVVSWEGAADIQSGDMLIVRIAESSLLDNFGQPDKNNSRDTNATHPDGERVHRTLPQPAVYQVTRQGHVHCDVSEGMLLDITPLDERGAKLITLYDKDLTEGVNLLIVVSENWGSQCVRLKVTVKSDNCGESQDCSGKGVCYTNVSMEGYECQCCPGYVGPHCEELDACNPSPCLNNGICVDLTQPLNGANYHCLCPYGRKCEKDPCYSEPCVNGGSCMSLAMNGSTTFHCACADGWTGEHCERPTVGGACANKPCVDLCSPSPCSPQRYCVDHGNSYSCECPHGYVGDECHLPVKSACDNNPCAHGGTCWSGLDSFYCSCRPGYTGRLCEEDFVLESVVRGDVRAEQRGGGSVREVRLPLGLYHDRLHNVYIAAGTLGAAIAIVGVVVTACHCRVNKTYSRLLSRLSRATDAGPPHHWLQDKRAPPAPAFPPPSNTLDTTDMYYTLDFSDSQSSPLIQ
ncbi:hypothetical protein MSG28_010992 [Choristoneura fumiferana]|uniref:Uncharacterized protein n=1 Tax=Choristoneura fumiferana TaxID=7141 RepID=A0ACC0KQ02_CHOFU|nr:hypothetical protein MSG28_010992 [Choristoneura fumiferana]